MPSIISRLGGSSTSKTLTEEARDKIDQENLNLANQGYIVERKLNKMPCHNKKCKNQFSIIQSQKMDEKMLKVAKIAQKHGKTTCSIIISHYIDAVIEEGNQQKFGRLTAVSEERTFVKCLKCSCQTEICIQYKEIEGKRRFFVCSVTEQEQWEGRHRNLGSNAPIR